MEEGKFNPVHFSKMVDHILQNFMTRKLVAQFTDYNITRDDIKMEISGQMDDDKSREALDDLFTLLEKETYLKTWFDEL